MALFIIKLYSECLSGVYDKTKRSLEASISKHHPNMHKRAAMPMMSPMETMANLLCLENAFCLPSLSLHTITFLLDGLGLGNGETLHCLVFLLLGFVLVRLLLVLAVRVDQHAAVECVAVSSGSLAGPGNAIHCRGGEQCR